MKTLVLTPNYDPVKVVSWETAITMAVNGKVRFLDEYDEVVGRYKVDSIRDGWEGLIDALQSHAFSGEFITIKAPAVVVLMKPSNAYKRGIKFSRLNVFTRDKFCCQYCGIRMKVSDLTYDHVIPKRLHGATSWENVVSSCYPCNRRKGGRTPLQAGMHLITKPVKPKYLPMLMFQVDVWDMPLEWKSYCKIRPDSSFIGGHIPF